EHVFCHRVPLIERPAHARELGALPREYKCVLHCSLTCFARRSFSIGGLTRFWIGKSNGNIGQPLKLFCWRDFESPRAKENNFCLPVGKSRIVRGIVRPMADESTS